MPILDGYETCKSITGIFSQKGVLKILQSSDDEENKERLPHAQNLESLKPIMIACSSHLDEQS